jgi:hypothetical protein
MRDEKIQINLNNVPMFDSPIDDTMKLKLLQDSWGELNIPQGSHLWNMKDASEALAVEPRPNYGHLSYGGFSFQNQRPQDLQIEYTRTDGGEVEADVKRNAFPLIVFCEVNKSVSINSVGDAVISYE